MFSTFVESIPLEPANKLVLSNSRRIAGLNIGFLRYGFTLNFELLTLHFELLTCYPLSLFLSPTNYP